MAGRVRVERSTGGYSRWDSTISRRREIIWNKEVDIIVETEEVGDPAWHGGQMRNLKRIDWPDHRRRMSQGTGGPLSWEEIRQHQYQEWETTTHGIANDVSKMTVPATKRYGWILIEKEAPLPDYKKKTNVRASGYPIQAELLESLRSAREKVGHKVRERLWGFKGGTCKRVE